MKSKVFIGLSLILVLSISSLSILPIKVAASKASNIEDEIHNIYLPLVSSRVYLLPENGPIAYVRNGNLWMVQADGSNVTQITYENGYSEPEWSHQGDRIAYIREFQIGEEPAWEIRIYNLATRQATVIVPAQLTGFVLIGNYFRYSYPRWSPDGQSLYFLQSDGRVVGDFINKVDIQTGARNQNFSPFFARSFDVAQFSGRIVYTDFSNYIPVGYSLNLATMDGSQRYVIVPIVNLVYFGSPRWSPEEETIATIANGDRFGTGSIARFDIHGILLNLYPQQISPYSSANLDWSPDGSYLIYDSLDYLSKVNTFTKTTTLFVPGIDPSWRQQDSPSSTDMVIIPVGEFQMGCDLNNNNGYPCAYDAVPLHTVYLDAYQIDTTETTNAMYARCVSAGGCTPPQESSSLTRSSYYGNPVYDDFPVLHVDWYQANTYCQWAGKRLPTEAEWEKAARGNLDTRPYPWGSYPPTCAITNFQEPGLIPCVGDTTEVGSYPGGASSYGVLDMSGNVYEWVNDWYQSNYYSVSPYYNPQGPTNGTYKSQRGGAFGYPMEDIFITLRVNPYSLIPNEPARSSYITGFRCADDH